MAEDASENLASLGQSVSSLVPSSFFFLPFNSKTELLSYLILCVAKMPFIPPVSIARSVSGLTAKERPIRNTSSTATLTRVQREDKGGSVKERLASNLKQLGQKSQPRSHLPTARAVSGAELHERRRERLLPSSQTDSVPASSSGESLSKTQQHKHANQSSVKGEPEVKARARHQEEVRFTLTLTPEAVLLLQRRNIERRQHLASGNGNVSGGGGGLSGSALDSRRRRENVSKRHQPATQRFSTHNSRAAAKNNSDAELGDISSIVKISLLNEQHKYDDVEYEEEEDHGVDESVVLKCTEWLRGLENTPVTVGHGLNKSASSVKGF
ncbi:proline-rich protein 18-like [Anoplopoma fimbria]|uniref:proline-rich protein 18-like n=1 Tax=Anoplopoma fimbria TaxID=229290 RepID=UPI0023EBA8B2|nr:proline-rich protein 18-like [Anoplopoma fimbria]